MLILTRKTGQGFTVGDNVEITITEISGDKVRVGINAPRQIKILRSELSQTLEINLEAAGPANSAAVHALAMGLRSESSFTTKKDPHCGDLNLKPSEADKPHG